MLSAVLTADVVNSTLLSRSEWEKLRQALNTRVASLPHQFYRGDSFQVFIGDASGALPLALKLRCLARKTAESCDVRMVVGLGSVKKPPTDLRTAEDEVFIRSGRSFDSLPPTERIGISLESVFPAQQSAMRILCAFTDHLFEHLTSKQASVLLELLEGKSQIEIARQLKKSGATINKQVRAGGWPQFEKLLAEYRILTGSISR